MKKLKPGNKGGASCRAKHERSSLKKGRQQAMKQFASMQTVAISFAHDEKWKVSVANARPLHTAAHDFKRVIDLSAATRRPAAVARSGISFTQRLVETIRAIIGCNPVRGMA